ncbi:hypothetical protein RQP46_002770 [Phenoliferia psychrophenolica]
MEPSIFYFGHVELVSETGEMKAKRSLTQPTLSFGRAESSDIQIALESCSRTHLTIEVDQDEPFSATALVGSANGVMLNGVRHGKGAVIDLEEGDTLDICGRFWRWRSATWESVPLNTPAAPRHYIAAPSSPSTPIRASSLNPPSLLANLLSPFQSASPHYSQTTEAAPVLATEDLISWDNNSERASDEDLIVWDQEEDAPESEDEEEEEEEAGLESEDESVRDADEPTPLGQAIPATPSLAQRSVHMTIIPADHATAWLRNRHAERAKSQMAAAAAAALAVFQAKRASPSTSPTTSPTKSSAHQLPPKTPSPSPPKRVADSGSHTSRRISALLLSGSAGSSRRSSGAFSPAGVDSDEDEEEDTSDDESSDDDDEEEELVHLPFPGSRKASVVPQPEVEEAQELEPEFEPEADYEAPVVFDPVEAPVDDEDVVMADAEPEEVSDDDSQSLAFAAAVPLPASPFVANAPSTPQPPRLPRHSTSRRLSLRERVLIRSAHTSAYKQQEQEYAAAASPSPSPSPPESPIAAVEQQGAMTDDDEVSDVDAEGEEDTSMEVIEQAPSTPVRSPSRPRDSIDVARSRSPKKVASPSMDSVFHETAPNDGLDDEDENAGENVSFNLAGTPSMASPTRVVEAPMPLPSPSPVEQHRPAPRRPRDSVALAKAHLALAAAIPLPETPRLATAYQDGPMASPFTATFGTPQTAPKTPDATPEASTSAAAMIHTPRAFARSSSSTNIFNDPALINDALRSFQREMMSPMNHHRVMPTPKSALRRLPIQTGRRKSIRGFLSAPPPPASTKRRVAFNTELFVQPIYDVRGKGIDEFLNDPELVRACKVPLPVTPHQASPDMPVSILKPYAFPSVEAPAPDSPSPSASTPASQRKAGRVLTGSPSLAVQRSILLETPSRRAGRVERTQEFLAAPPSPGLSRSKSSTDFFPQQADAAEPARFLNPPPTPGFGRSQSTGQNNRPSLAELLASPAPRIGTFQAPRTGPRNGKADMLARIERLRRKSMPGQEHRFQLPLSTPKAAAAPSPTPAPAAVVEQVVEQPVEQIAESLSEEIAAPGVEAVIEEEEEEEELPAPEIAIDIASAPASPLASLAVPGTPTPSHTNFARSPSPSSPASPLFAPLSPFVAHADGAQEMLFTTPSRASPHVSPSATPTPAAELEIEESGEANESLPSDHLDSVDLGTHGADDLARIDDFPAPIVEILEAVAGPAPVDPAPAVAEDERAAEEEVVEEAPAAEPQVEELPVEPVVPEESLQEAPLPEEPVLADSNVEVDAPAPLVETPLPVEEVAPAPASDLPAAADAADAAEVEVEAAEVEAPVVKRGRGAKAAIAKKSAIPTRGRKAPAAAQPDEEEAVISAPVPEEKAEAEVEVEEAPKKGRAKALPVRAIPTRRGRTAKAVEEVAAPEPTPEPKPTRRAAAKKVAEVVVEVAQPTTPASSSRSKRTAAKPVEEASESVTPVPKLSRKRSKSVVIHHDEVAAPPVPALPSPTDPKPSTSRSKRVLQPTGSADPSDVEELAAKPTPKARGRAKTPVATEEEDGVKENAAKAPKKAAVKKAPALKQPGEPIPTGRTLRSRG